MVSEAPKRIRMSPEARRTQLLDTARSMIVAKGLQPFTMEALARTALVSSPLVYNYFESRLALLCELLDREHQAMSREIVTNLRDAKSFESVVRVFVQSNFDHHAPGRVLPILLSQPEVAKTVRAKQRKDQRRTGRFLAKSVADEYALDPSQAELLLRMSSGASIGAAEYGERRAADRDATVEAAVRFILAGMRSSMQTE